MQYHKIKWHQKVTLRYNYITSTLFNTSTNILNIQFQKFTENDSKSTWYTSARNKDQKLVGHFLKIFYGVIKYCPIENVQENWPTKMDFGRPNAEIGRKMVNGWLLFLALIQYMPIECIMYSW